MIRVIAWIASPIFVTALVCSFLLFHLLFVISHWIGPQTYRWMVDRGNFMLVACLKLIASRFTVSTPQPPITQRPLIFVANHQSLFDIPLIIWFLRSYEPHFIAKQELGKWVPSVSHALRNMGSALIDRSDSQQALARIQEFGASMNNQRGCVVIFPEGTRARDGTMRRFRTAGLRALLKSMPSAWIVPLVVDGSWQVLPTGMLPVSIGTKIALTALAPLDREALSDEEAIKLCEERIRHSLAHHP